MNATAPSPTAPPKLSRRQRQIVEYLGYYQGLHGYPPNIREIGEAVGLSSSSTVFSHLRTLQARGVVVGKQGQPRSYKLAEGPGPGLRDVVAAFVEAWDSLAVKVGEPEVAAFVERARGLL